MNLGKSDFGLTCHYDVNDWREENIFRILNFFSKFNNTFFSLNLLL